MKKLGNIKYLISISILIFVIILGMSVYSNAEEIDSQNTTNAQTSSSKERSNWVFKPDGKGYHSTTHNGEDLVFCVELGAPLKNPIPDNLPQFYNDKQIFCNVCQDSSWRPAVTPDGSKIGYTTEMEDPQIVDYKEHQDVAYALAYETNQEKIQTVIWKSSLDASGGSDLQTLLSIVSQYISDDGLAEEAQAYKKFYEEKEAAGGFKPVDKTDYEKIKVIANQNDNSYIIGKFSIDYTKGIFKIGNKVVKFGYMEKIILKDQDGEEVEIADILDANGKSIMTRSDYRFPNSDEEFYIKFYADPEKEITEVYMDAKFKYLDECKATMIKWTGKIYEWGYTKQFVTPLQAHKKDCTYHPAEYENGVLVSSSYYTHENCHYKDKTHYYGYYYELKKGSYSSAYDSLQHKEAQDLMTVEKVDKDELGGGDDIGDEGAYAKPIWKEIYLYGDEEDGPNPIRLIDLTMEIGGLVFLDIPGEKKTGTTDVNGIFEEKIDKVLENVEVTLYEVDEQGNKKLATIAPKGEVNKSEDKEQTEEIITNPTLTDKNGKYSFKRLNSQKKYFVTYKVNGQMYESTLYTAKVAEYNKDGWKVSNMASLLDEDRQEYNGRFETIESSPNNYKVKNKIFESIGDTNKTYRIFEPAYEKGIIEAKQMKLLQDKINEKIHEYITKNKKYPDDLAKRAIYGQVASENENITEVKNKIQYIVDMEVVTTTGHHSERQYYPVYDEFVIGNEEETIGDKTYLPIYEGQKQINAGVIEREKFDLKLSKDIYTIKLTINGKEYNYKCNGRQDEPVPVEVRGSDVSVYQRELKESDIQFIDYINNDTKKLRLYVTYKIRVANQSNEAITGYVTGINDFYDADYTYLKSHIVKYNAEGIDSENQIHWKNDTQNHKLSTNDGNISRIALKVNEYFDIYTDFEVSTDALRRIFKEKESTKENYAEITGYKTYYEKARSFKDKDGNILDTINEDGAPAGLVDRDSRPGDFDLTDSAKRFEVEEFVKYSYTDDFKDKESNIRTTESLNVFQDDADKAPGLKLILSEVIRELNGNVWEDSVLSDVLLKENIRRGDGENINDNHPIKGMKVELIDLYEENNIQLDLMNEQKTVIDDPYKFTKYNKVADIYNDGEKEFKQAVTYTDQMGAYQFKGYVPGDYLIRYTYGEGKTLTTDSNGKVYNGQDYKSTLYTDETHFAGEKEKPNYWYNVKNDNRSDAHDNYELRNAINNKNVTMTNHIATILDYQVANGDISTDNNLKELQERSIMFAETNKLVLEVEYAKTESANNDESLKEYKVNNIDFGIVERPRSELTMIKDVSNIRIIANDGQTIFDTEQQTANLGWIRPSEDPYSGQHGKINPIVDENLLHGATIKILYNFTIKNTGERDFSDGNNGIDIDFYNTGKAGKTAVKTKAEYIVDYVENNLKFSPDDKLDNIDKNKGYNKHWVEIADKNELNSGDDNKLVNLDMKILNGYTTILRATDDSPLLSPLAPANKGKTDGESATTTLLLTKLLNTDNDDLIYDNSVEIVKTTNNMGRRSYNNLDPNINDVTKTVKSIPGNHNPTKVAMITEPDANNAETVTVNVPFGEENKTPFIIGISLAVVILAGGIFLIKKKVLKK